MQHKDIKLTLIGNKERLDNLVERAQNIFKVVAQNYDNDVITLVDDIYLAIKHPLKITGWEHDWQPEEKSKLEDPYQKCLETMEMANDAKKTTRVLLNNLNVLYEKLHNLSDLSEKTKEYIDKFASESVAFKAKISFLESKSTISRQESAWLQELQNNLILLEDSQQALESLKEGILAQRDDLAGNIENLADLFFDEEIPLERINLAQEINMIINLINTLYAGVKNTYVRQSEVIDALGKLFLAMSERCDELIAIVNSMLKSSQELCDKSDRLLQYNPE